MIQVGLCNVINAFDLINKNTGQLHGAGTFCRALFIDLWSPMADFWGYFSYNKEKVVQKVTLFSIPINKIFILL